MTKLINRPLFGGILFLTLLSACSAKAPATDAFKVTGSDGVTLLAEPLAVFDSPWAMTFLPDGRALVTEKAGAIWLLNRDGSKADVLRNTPAVVDRGQGGMGDVIVHPQFAKNRQLFLSYIERDAKDDGISGAVVERATLTVSDAGPSLTDRKIIWRQTPKLKGNGHYGHRLVISPDNKLFVTSGERQKFNPAQNMGVNLGKILRLNLDGTVPKDNPFAERPSPTNQIWSLGHRNPLGIAFNANGQLWEHEMGPRGGDELNRIIRGENYGYPEVSEGSHYSGKSIPPHSSRPEFKPPVIAWSPVISPSGLVIYDGKLFSGWRGDGLIGGLSGQALVRVSFNGDSATEAARYSWDKRIREVEQGPKGALYVLEDRDGGRLLRLSPGK